MKQILLNPGPANTSDTVKSSLVVDDICPREKEFGLVLDYICDNITDILLPKSYNHKDLYSTVLFGSSGTGAIESTITSVCSDEKDEILIISNGEYGKRAAEIADRYKIKNHILDFYDNQKYILNYDTIEKTIKDKKPSHVYIVHCETTTGVLNNIHDIGELCKKYNSTFIVDAMSTFCCYNIDMLENNIDFLISSSNKNLQGMAGLSFVTCNLNKLKELKFKTSKSYYFDLFAQYNNLKNKNQTRFTPPVQIAYATIKAIEELIDEGLEKRYKRIEENYKILNNELKKLGLKTLIPDEYNSIIIRSYYDLNSKEHSFEKMHEYFKQKGYTIYPGKVANINTFRLSNIGILTKENIKDFLIEFKNYLKLIKWEEHN